MFDESRIKIYNYLYDLFYGVVSNNIYRMDKPTETTESDVNDGFVAISVGGLNDDSEFVCNAYGWARCYVYAYVPKRSRGRVNTTLYSQFEDSINQVVNSEIINGNNSVYYISGDNVLSTDTDETTQKGNQYHVYIKSFVVVVDGIHETDTNTNNN